MRIAAALAMLVLLSACGEAETGSEGSERFITIYHEEVLDGESYVYCYASDDPTGFIESIYPLNALSAGDVEAEDGASWCQTFYDLTENEFVFRFDHDRGAEDGAHSVSAETKGIVRFSVDVDTAFELIGDYDIDDQGADSGEDFFGVNLYGPEYGLLSAFILSENTIDESLSLIAPGGGDTISAVSGETSGMLEAGKIYTLEFQARISTRQAYAPSAFSAEAAGEVRLDFYRP